MTFAGQKTEALLEADLAEDFYANMRQAHNEMLKAFEHRASEGLSQDDLATLLGVDKSLISRRLNGGENLTYRTLSYMASALRCFLEVKLVPYEQMPKTNQFWGCHFDTSKHFEPIVEKQTVQSSVKATQAHSGLPEFLKHRFDGNFVAIS